MALALVGCGDGAPPTAAGGEVLDSAGAGSDADAGLHADSPQCPPAPSPAAVDPARSKFALSMFHYNIEYVIGGLEVPGEAGALLRYFDNALFDATGWGDEAVEDWIIVESFEPVLDLYLAHPTWGVNLEMQGRMVEAMAERHAGVLDKLRALAQRGQAELVSFHMSDQLFLAYPEEDLVRSIEATKQVFADHCLPLSGVVFNQEGQAGEGRQRVLVDQGYEVGVFPKNLWRYVRGEGAWWPWYASRGGTLVVGPGGVDPASGVEVAWDFFDDGELRSVIDGANPYFAPVASHDPGRVAAFEAQLAQREADGWHVTTVGDYVRHLEAKGVDKPEAPPLLDGTWQPPSTDSIHRWLGGRSQVLPDDEEDNRVRSSNARQRVHVMAAQVMYEVAEEQGLTTAAHGARLDAAWRKLWRAQVSDGSGVNPWRGEVLTCLREGEDAVARADALRAELAEALGLGSYAVDLEARAVETDAAALAPTMPQPVDAATFEPPLVPTVEAPGREVTTTWFDDGSFTLDISAAAPDCVGDCDPRMIRVGFPQTADAVIYTPGPLHDEVVAHPLDAFDFLLGEAWLPLANGLLGLGDGRWVIKHTRDVHIAARVAPDTDTWLFEDGTIQATDATRWRFTVFDGGETDALALAARVNVHPTLVQLEGAAPVVVP